MPDDPIPFPDPQSPVTHTGKLRAGRPKGKTGNGPPDSPGSGGHNFKLTGEDMALIQRLAAAGQSAEKIARVLSADGRTVTARTVQRWQARAKAPNETLAIALASLRHLAVDGWAQAIKSGSRYGKHAPSRDLLQATGVIERNDPADRITIHVGDGTIAIGRLPDVLLPRALPLTIDHKPVDPDA